MKLLLPAIFTLIVPAYSQLNIDVDHTSLFQEFYGCGASWTDSSAWLMYGDRNPGDYRALTDSERNAIYSDLFGSDGIGLKILRQPMGTSDFRWSDYSYEDVQGSFSIDRDRSYILPALHRTLLENNQVKVMALPWSPPAWMKQNGSLNGGSLKSDAYGDLGQYFADFVQAYEAEGIPIWAVSIQNEPLHEADYPTMKMTEAEHAQAIVAVRAALRSDIKVVGFDHNWELDWFPRNLLDNHPDAKAAVSAIGFHCYGETTPEVQTYLKNAHPEVEVFFTECTESGPVQSFNGDFRWALSNLVIGATRNWASTVIEWNLLLDGNGGPKRDGGCTNCRGLIDIVGWDANNLQYLKRPTYYALGHLSKFAADGARRIESSQPDSDTKTVAMINPDNSALLIVLNNDSPDRTYNVNWFNLICPLTVPSWSAVTLFRIPGSNDVQVWATYDQPSGGLVRVADITCSSTGVTSAPIGIPTGTPIAATPPPTVSPVAPPTAGSPTASPLEPPTTTPVISPTITPVAAPTAYPVASASGCCTQDGITCLHAGHYCEPQSRCGVIDACNYVSWLSSGGDPTPAPFEAPTAVPVESPTLAPIDPTAAPVDPPTAAPVDSPTSAPVDPPTSAPVAPTSAPVDPPTLSPVAAPTSGIPTTGIACCSQDGVNCLHAGHFCGSESICGVIDSCLYVFWLPNGVPVDSSSCNANYQGNCNEKSCCPGLTCVGTGWGLCQLV